MKLLSRYIFQLGFFLILLSGLAIILNHAGFALRLIDATFWVMAGGTLVYILNLR